MQNKSISKQSTLLRLSIFAVVALFVLGVVGLFQALATDEVDATQSVPYRINYQGRISDNQGSILPDGTYNVTFRLFDGATGGTAIWTETRTGGNQVQVTNGLFNIQLGEVEPLPESTFSTYPLYLEVELPTPATVTSASPDWSEGPFSPRQRLASSPYAFNADQLDGLSSEDFVQLSPGSAQTGGINVDGSIQGASVSVSGQIQGGSLNITGAGSFTSTVSGADAVEQDEFTTLSQLQGIDVSSSAFLQGGNDFGAMATLGTTTANDLRFITNDLERMRILANGNVGIGVVGPAYALDVAGDINTTGAYRVNGSQISTSDLSDGNNITLQGNTFNGADQLVQLNATGQLPALDGSLLTDLNASALTSGTLNIDRIADASITNAKLVNDSLTVTAGTGLTGGGSVALGGTTTVDIDTTYFNNNYYTQTSADDEFVTRTGDTMAGNLDLGSNDLLSIGNLGIGTGIPGYALDVQAGTGIVANFSGRVQGADAVEDGEFITKGQLDTALDGVATSDGLFTEDSSGSPTFTYLTNTTSDLVLGSNTIANASFYFDTAASNLFLGTDGVSDGALTLYSSGASINPATISVNASGDLNLSSGSGKVVVGGGSGDIELVLSDEADSLIAEQQAGITGAYSGSDFQFNRNITNTVDTQTSGGAVLSVSDNSTLQAGTTANYDLIYGNANPTGATFSGNLMRLQNAGTTQFLVTADGTVEANLFQGSGAQLTNLDASNISSGTLSVNRIADGSLTNAKLVNDSLTVTAGTGLSGGGSVALGGSTTLNVDTTYFEGGYFAQDGNAFGATATLGTTDNQALELITNNATRLTIANDGTTTLDGSLLPGTDDTYDLGSSTARWRDLYLGPQSVNIGTDANNATIGYNTTASQLQLSADTQIQGNGYVDGSLGVGTTSPGSLLTVQAGTGDNDLLRVVTENSQTMLSVRGAYSGWSQVNTESIWGDRSDFGLLSYDDALWVIGGIYPGTFDLPTWSSSVYRSDDGGVNWTQPTSSAAFGSLSSANYYVFDNKMWVAGGINNSTDNNDVYSSTDGATWTLETSSPGWINRADGGHAVFDGKMWIIGGYSGAGSTTIGDVWSSPDGVNWTEENASPPWSDRSDLTTLVFDNKLWVMGGTTNGAASGALNDVWSSTDGVTWTEETASANWPARLDAGGAVYDGKMWIYGGQNSGGSTLQDVWSSTDGATWTQENDAPWPTRRTFGTTTHQNSIYVMGGQNSSRLNDIWTYSVGDGGVGIGTNMPSYALDVAGDINTTGTYRVNGSQISTSNLSDGNNITLQGNTFNGADQLVQLNATGQLPALDGSLLTDLNASALTSGTLNIDRIADASITNAKLVNDSLTVTAGTGLTGGGSVPLGGSVTLNIDDTYIDDNYFGQGGNAFGATGVLGTTDTQDLSILTNNAEAMRILANGNVGIGVSNPQEALDVAGGIRLGNSGNTNAGTIRWTGTDFEGYDGTAWLSLTDTGSGGGGLTGTGNNGELAVFDSGGNLEGFANLTWDSGAGRLSVGALTSGAEIVVGGSTSTTAGAIRFNGTDFEGYDGAAWQTFTGGGSSAGVSSLRGLDGSLNLQGTPNQITVSDNTTDTITLALPQDINTTSNVEFANLTVADLTASGTVTFTNYDCSTFANGGKLTVNASGTVVCADDIAGEGGAPGSQTQILVPEFAGGTLSADGVDNNGVMTADHISGLASGEGYQHNFYEWSTSQSTVQDYDVVIRHPLPNNFNGTNGFSGSWSAWVYADSIIDGNLEFTIQSADGTTCVNAESVAPSSTATWQQVSLTTDPETTCSFTANDVITIKVKMISAEPSTNKVRLGEIQYQYTP